MNFRMTIRAFRSFGNNLFNALSAESHYMHKRRIKIADKINPAGYYVDWLEAFHTELAPKTYLEIGVDSGRTLNLANLSKKAVGIDPAFSVQHSVKNTILERVTSDEFFRDRVVSALDDATIDFCFIDGLHEYHQVVRDVLNCGRYCTDDAVIVLHDVVPPDEKSALANRKTKLWPGDVYKVLPFLAANFAGLNISVIRTAPTGLAVLTSVATIRESSLTEEILSGNERAVDEYDNLSVGEFMDDWLPKFKSIGGHSVDITAVRKLVENQSRTGDASYPK